MIIDKSLYRQTINPKSKSRELIKKRVHGLTSPVVTVALSLPTTTTTIINKADNELTVILISNSVVAPTPSFDLAEIKLDSSLIQDDEKQLSESFQTWRGLSLKLP